MYNHNKAQQSKNRVHISWGILYTSLGLYELTCITKLQIQNYNQII